MAEFKYRKKRKEFKEQARVRNNDYVKFHFAKKDGTYRPVLDHGRIVKNRYYGNVFYVLIMDCALVEPYYDEK